MHIWRITCVNGECCTVTSPIPIEILVDSAKGYLDEHGWFRCKRCGDRAFIVNFSTQKNDSSFEPILLGIIRPGGLLDRTHPPITFLVSFALEEPPQLIWFYEHLDNRRPRTGPLTYTPEDVLDLLPQMVKTGFLDADKVIDAVQEVRKADG